MSFERAEFWSRQWQVPLFDAGDVGHINAQSGHGEWHQGSLCSAPYTAVPKWWWSLLLPSGASRLHSVFDEGASDCLGTISRQAGNLASVTDFACSRFYRSVF